MIVNEVERSHPQKTVCFIVKNNALNFFFYDSHKTIETI